MRVRVTHDIDDLASDLRQVATKAPPKLARAVRKSAEEGNRIAKGFASEQHTMNSDIDVPYQESFSAEASGPLTWVYGPVADGVKHGGSQAKGYENGSRNQRAHLNLARSVDIIGPRFADDIDDVVDGLFW